MTSTQPRKQRKSRYQAPLHERHKLIGAMLSDLKRNTEKCTPVHKDDTVKVLRGDHKGTEGKLAQVDLKKNDNNR
jgi:large subunit ribosomal protein L24